MTFQTRITDTASGNLLGVWPLEETGGTTASDVSGNGYDGTYDGATLNGYSNPDGNAAPSFDGTNDEVSNTDAGLLAAIDPDEFTVMVWIKMASGEWSNATQRLAVRIYQSGANFMFIRKDSANTLLFRHYGGSTVEVSVGSQTSEAWMCVAMTGSVAADEFKAYIDGSQVGTTQTGIASWGVAPVEVVLGSSGSGNYWKGGLALAAVWDTPLSASQISYLAGSLTTPDAVIRAYIDFDQDGFTSADEVTTDVRSGSATLGIWGQDERIAEVGQLTLTLDNSTRKYTPDNSSSSVYGKIVPKTPVQLTGIGNSGTVELWTGFIASINVESQRYGSRYCDIICQDRLREYQDNEDVAIPLQTDISADDLLRLIDATTYMSASATATITAADVAANNDTITIGTKVYTIKDTLTPSDGEIGNFTDRFNNQATAADHYYIDDTILNVAAAINHDDHNSDTYYASATARNAQVVATVDHPAFGWPLSQADTYLYLAFTGGGSYTQLACVCTLPDDTIENVTTIGIPLEKVGSPTGTLTISIVELGGDGFPTTVLVDANATTTRAESSLPASTAPDALVNITFPGSFTIPGNTALVIETDTTPNASNYVQWAAEGTGSSLRGGALTYASAWATSSSNLIFWSVGVCTLTANAPGTWANSVALAASSYTVSASNLSGGTQPTAFTPSYATGDQEFEYAADTWLEGVNAMTAIEETVESEVGLYAIGRDGAPVFKNTFYWFAAHDLTRVTVDNTQADFSARYTIDDVRNSYTIDYRRRDILTGVTIGKGPRVIKLLPGSSSFAGTTFQSGRWQSSGTRANEGWAKTITISTVNEDTGEAAGVVEVDPPQLGTHYTLNTKLRTELGQTLTNPKLVRLSWAINGAGVELTIVNVSSRLLWMHDLYLDGDVLDYSANTQVVVDDSTSITSYGVAPGSYTLWLPTGEPFATALGEYLIALHKDPRTVAETLTIDVVDYATSGHVFDIDLFDVLDVDEYQWSFSNPCMVMGIEYQFDAESVTNVVFALRQLDPYEYLILDDATYGQLDSYSLAL